MAANGSPYDALGLEPDADPVSIERAYKRLIWLYHPDREGGDAQRAAEINRAYSELRAELGPKDMLVLAHDGPLEEPRRGRWWVRAAVVLLVALGALLAVTGPVAAYIRQLMPPVPQFSPGEVPPTAGGADAMDQPLHLGAIQSGVRQALAALGSHNDSALAGKSRDCHRMLRASPSVSQLDHCAAFDDAVVEIENHDPMWDHGPFGQIAVTGRQWSAASALSNDYLAIDSRLDRIRVQVELALAPPEPARAVPNPSLSPGVSSAAAIDESALQEQNSEGEDLNFVAPAEPERLPKQD